MRGKGFSALIANGVATRVENIFDPFDKLEDYEELFPILPQPTSIKTWQSNTSFAYQRLAGVNPMVICGISSLPDNFPVSDAIFPKAMGSDSNSHFEKNQIKFSYLGFAERSCNLDRKRLLAELRVAQVQGNLLKSLQTLAPS